MAGVMSAENALAAIEIGADAIVVSNHADYALDYCLSPLEVLPGIIRAVSGRTRQEYLRTALSGPGKIDLIPY